MAVFRPSRAICQQWRIYTKRPLSILNIFKNKGEEWRSKPKSMSALLQVFINKPILDKDIQDNGLFFDLLRVEINRILNNKTEIMLKSFDKGDLNREEFDKLAGKVGLNKLSDEEICRFFPHHSSAFAYPTSDGPLGLVDVYVSNKEIKSQSERNAFSLKQIFSSPHKFDKAVILLKQPKYDKLFFNSFVNLSANDTTFILPGSKVRGNVPYKILLSSLMGLSLGSVTSSVVSEFLYLPSNTLMTMSAASILASSYVWGKLRDDKNTVLLKKCKILNDCSRATGRELILLMQNEIISNNYLEVLAVYSYLLREKENLTIRGNESEHLEVDDYLQRKFNKWAKEELNFQPAKTFNFDEILKLMRDMELVRGSDDSTNHLHVVPFKDVLVNLQNKEQAFSDINDCKLDLCN